MREAERNSSAGIDLALGKDRECWHLATITISF